MAGNRRPRPRGPAIRSKRDAWSPHDLLCSKEQVGLARAPHAVQERAAGAFTGHPTGFSTASAQKELSPWPTTLGAPSGHGANAGRRSGSPAVRCRRGPERRRKPFASGNATGIYPRTPFMHIAKILTRVILWPLPLVGPASRGARHQGSHLACLSAIAPSRSDGGSSLRTWGQDNPEAYVGVGVGRGDAAKGNPAVPRVAAPTAAAQHAGGAR